MNLIDLTSEVASGWSAFSFPDGQPHVSISLDLADPGPIMLVARIASSDDLLRVLLAQNAIQSGVGPRPVHLAISYLLGARMDRAIPPSYSAEGSVVGTYEPFSLRVVADVLATGGFSSISVFDPHSDVALALLNARPILPVSHVKMALASLPDNVVLVAPDAGAVKRVEAIASALGIDNVVHALKHRDVRTGHLSGFEVVDGGRVLTKHCLIVDDLIDGGRTFTGVADVLRAAGAATVNLYVSHGIFSKGFDIPGIDRIFTTDSYRAIGDAPEHVTVFPWRGWS